MKRSCDRYSAGKLEYEDVVVGFSLHERQTCKSQIRGVTPSSTLCSPSALFSIPSSWCPKTYFTFWVRRGETSFYFISKLYIVSFLNGKVVSRVKSVFQSVKIFFTRVNFLLLLLEEHIVGIHKDLKTPIM